jgi:hypothetical protein
VPARASSGAPLFTSQAIVYNSGVGDQAYAGFALVAVVAGPRSTPLSEASGEAAHESDTDKCGNG